MNLSNISAKNIYTTHWQEAIEKPKNLAAQLRLFSRNRLLDTLSLLSNNTTQTPFLRCLFCHYVFDDLTDEFENIIIELKKIAQFIDTETAVAMINGTKPIDGQYFHLSFDDGLKNNFTNALPILIKHQVPAIFFVPSGLIDADWQKAAHYCLETTNYSGVIEIASWSDLKAAISAGYEIGSHSRNHVRLSTLANQPEQLYQEVQRSKIDIEQQLGIECKYIAWPYGRLQDINAEGFAAIKAAGYHAAFGNFRAEIIPGKTDLLAVPRHHFEAHWPIRHIRYFANGHMESK